MLEFGERLKHLRKEKGILQSQLAERLSVTRALISAYESGTKSPSIDMLIKLSRSFHVTTDYLLGIEKGKTLNIDGLTEKQVNIIYNLISEFKK